MLDWSFSFIESSDHNSGFTSADGSFGDSTLDDHHLAGEASSSDSNFPLVVSHSSNVNCF